MVRHLAVGRGGERCAAVGRSQGHRVRVERRRRGQGPDIAGSRVHDRGRRLGIAGERGLGRALEVGLDGEADVRGGNERPLDDRSSGSRAVGIHEQGQGGPAAQEPLGAGLDPPAAGDLAGLVSVDHGTSSGLLLRQRRRVADRLAGERLLWVDPQAVGAVRGQHRAVGGENLAAGRERSFLEQERATGRPELGEEELRGPANLPAGRPLGQLEDPVEHDLARRARSGT